MKTKCEFLIKAALISLLFLINISILMSQSAGSLKLLNEKAENENVKVVLKGTYYVDGTNFLRVTSVNKTSEPTLIAVDVRNLPGLWYFNVQTHYCIFLRGKEIKKVDIPLPAGFYRFLEDSKTRISVFQAESEKSRSFSVFDNRTINFYEPYVQQWDFCSREQNFGFIDALYEKWFDAKDLFDNFMDVEKNFNIYASNYFEIYAHKNSIANEQIEQIITRREMALDTLCMLLDVDIPDQKLRLVFYPDAETKTNDTDHTGMGYAFGLNVVEIYNEEEKLDDYHEIAHVVVGLVGNPPAMLNEGFAVYASEKLGAEAIAAFGHGSKTIDQATKEFFAKEKLIPIEKLFAYTEIGSHESQPKIAYPQAASFTKFIIETYGYEKFKVLLADLKNSNDPEIMQQNKTRFNEIIGCSLEMTTAKWLEKINKIIY